MKYAVQLECDLSHLSSAQLTDHNALFCFAFFVASVLAKMRG